MKIQLIKAIKNDPDHARKQVEAKEMLQKLYPNAEIWTPDEIIAQFLYFEDDEIEIKNMIYKKKYYVYTVACLQNIAYSSITHFFDVDKYNGEEFESNGKIIERAFCAEIGITELIIVDGTNKCIAISNNSGYCSKEKRKDKKDIIFKEIKEINNEQKN